MSPLNLFFITLTLSYRCDLQFSPGIPPPPLGRYGCPALKDLTFSCRCLATFNQEQASFSPSEFHVRNAYETALSPAGTCPSHLLHALLPPPALQVLSHFSAGRRKTLRLESAFSYWLFSFSSLRFPDLRLPCRRPVVIPEYTSNLVLFFWSRCDIPEKLIRCFKAFSAEPVAFQWQRSRRHRFLPYNVAQALR